MAKKTTENPTTDTKTLKLPSGESFEIPKISTDIFQDVGEILFKEGIYFQYLIKQNGQTLGYFEHADNMLEMLQDRFGGGNYYIQLRIDGQVKSTSTMNLKAAPKASKEVSSSEEETPVPPYVFAPPAKEKESLDLNGVAALITALKPEPVAPKDDTMVLEIAKMQQETSKQMFQNLKDQMMEMGRQTSETFKALISELKEMRTSKKTGEEISLKDYIEAKDAARKEGYEQAMKLHEIAENKARERLEEQEAIEEDAKERALDEATPKTTMDRILEGFLPFLARGMAMPVMRTPALPPANTTQAPRTVPQDSSLFGLPSRTVRKENKAPANVTPIRPEVKVETPPDHNTQMLKLGILQTLEPVLQPAFDLLMTETHEDKDAASYAEKCLEVLKANKIVPSEALKLFTRSELLQVANAMQLPESSEPWLNSFYDSLEKGSSPIGTDGVGTSG